MDKDHSIDCPFMASLPESLAKEGGFRFGLYYRFIGDLTSGSGLQRYYTEAGYPVVCCFVPRYLKLVAFLRAGWHGLCCFKWIVFADG